MSNSNSESTGIDRRTFIQAASAVGAGIAMAPIGARGQAAAPAARKRYALVGLGSRCKMYRDAIMGDYKAHAEAVGVCDINPGRVELARTQLTADGKAPAGYAPADFEKMIRETKPDYVIVTTVDATHDDYIVRALQAGCDVITEKPLTTTAEKCQRILDACNKSGKNIRVTFNYRYSPPRTQVKDVLMSGEIGDILSVDFHWLLNTVHGADYFRRWHAHKKNSGGLMLHKASHHFDLVNWWLGAVPVSVQGMGKREYYTPAMARRMGLSGPHERCLTCTEKDKCTFYMDLAANKELKALYLDNEKHDGYYRDRCVFRPEIDIEDTMSLQVKYDTGVTMAYSLNTFNAWEGYHIAFNGTKGRLEHTIVEQIYVSGTNTVQGGIAEDGVTTRVIPMRGAAKVLEPWSGAGAHGGGDKVMLDEIFLPNAPADKYLRASDQFGGAASILTGVAANKCFETGQTVKIAELVTGFQRPKYAPMPTHDQTVPMPKAPAKA